MESELIRSEKDRERRWEAVLSVREEEKGDEGVVCALSAENQSHNSGAQLLIFEVLS